MVIYITPLIEECSFAGEEAAIVIDLESEALARRHVQSWSRQFSPRNRSQGNRSQGRARLSTQAPYPRLEEGGGEGVSGDAYGDSTKDSTANARL